MFVGFPEQSSDVRLAQYEAGPRKPKADLAAALAQALDVAPQALNVPDTLQQREEKPSGEPDDTFIRASADKTDGQPVSEGEEH